MKYIGNKTRILDFIEQAMIKSKINYKNVKVADLFAGTGSVSRLFLKNNCETYSCDNMTYSICEQYRTNYFTSEPLFEELKSIINGTKLDDVLSYLNSLEGREDYYFENYAPSGKYKRQFFSDKNAKKIDAIAITLTDWKKILPEDKYNYLNGIFMCSADKVSNTSGTYGAYLKIWRSMALKDIFLEKPDIISTGINHIFQDDVLDFVKNNKGFDIIYLDPPYNKRQYASNFHVLENIVVNDKPELKGKTGLRNYENQKSDYCIKSKVLNSFSNLVKNMDTKYIIMSYSSEGLLTEKEIKEVLLTRGIVNIFRYNYRRFKTNSWTSDNTGLQELLFVCEVKIPEIKK